MQVWVIQTAKLLRKLEQESMPQETTHTYTSVPICIFINSWMRKNCKKVLGNDTHAQPGWLYLHVCLEAFWINCHCVCSCRQTLCWCRCFWDFIKIVSLALVQCVLAKAGNTDSQQDTFWGLWHGCQNQLRWLLYSCLVCLASSRCASILGWDRSCGRSQRMSCLVAYIVLHNTWGAAAALLSTTRTGRLLLATAVSLDSIDSRLCTRSCTLLCFLWHRLWKLSKSRKTQLLHLDF